MTETHSEFRHRLQKQSRRVLLHARSIKDAYRLYLTKKRDAINDRLFVILHLNYHLSHTKYSDRIKSALKSYLRKVDNDVFSKNSNKRLQRYVVIENIHHLYKRNHIQLEIELPSHLNKFQLRQILFQNLNNQIVKLFHTAVADDDVSLIDYNCKDFEHIEQNQTEEIFDEVNTYFV